MVNKEWGERGKEETTLFRREHRLNSSGRKKRGEDKNLELRSDLRPVFLQQRAKKEKRRRKKKATSTFPSTGQILVAWEEWRGKKNHKMDKLNFAPRIWLRLSRGETTKGEGRKEEIRTAFGLATGLQHPLGVGEGELGNQRITPVLRSGKGGKKKEGLLLSPYYQEGTEVERVLPGHISFEMAEKREKKGGLRVPNDFHQREGEKKQFWSFHPQGERKGGKKGARDHVLERVYSWKSINTSRRGRGKKRTQTSYYLPPRMSRGGEGGGGGRVDYHLPLGNGQQEEKAGGSGGPAAWSWHWCCSLNGGEKGREGEGGSTPLIRLAREGKESKSQSAGRPAPPDNWGERKKERGGGKKGGAACPLLSLSDFLGGKKRRSSLRDLSHRGRGKGGRRKKEETSPFRILHRGGGEANAVITSTSASYAQKGGEGKERCQLSG